VVVAGELAWASYPSTYALLLSPILLFKLVFKPLVVSPREFNSLALNSMVDYGYVGI